MNSFTSCLERICAAHELICGAHEHTWVMAHNDHELVQIMSGAHVCAWHTHAWHTHAWHTHSTLDVHMSSTHVRVIGIAPCYWHYVTRSHICLMCHELITQSHIMSHVHYVSCALYISFFIISHVHYGILSHDMMSHVHMSLIMHMRHNVVWSSCAHET